MPLFELMTDDLNINVSPGRTFFLNLTFSTPHNKYIDLSFAAANDKSMYLLCGVEKVRFKKKVLPGDTLIFKSSVISSKRGIWKFKSSAYSEEKLVCSAEILCADRSLNE